MKRLFWILSGISYCFAQNQDYAFDASLALSNSSVAFFPVPSVSFYWLKSRGNHELSAEFFTRTSGELPFDPKSESFTSFGLSYSFLFALPVACLYAGPTLGLFGSLYRKKYNSSNGFGGYDQKTDDKSGLYFCGFKTAAVFGRNTIRFKIQERLVFGIYEENGSSSYGMLNSLNAGIIFAF